MAPRKWSLGLNALADLPLKRAGDAALAAGIDVFFYCSAVYRFFGATEKHDAARQEQDDKAGDKESFEKCVAHRFFLPPTTVIGG